MRFSRGITTKKNPRTIADLSSGNKARLLAGTCSFSVTMIAQKVPLISAVMLTTSMIPAL